MGKNNRRKFTIECQFDPYTYIFYLNALFLIGPTIIFNLIYHIYLTLTVVCGGDIQLTRDQSIDSPNYPLDYMPDKECVWRITAPDNHQVALKFQSFELEKHDGCAYDYVEIRDGNHSDSRLIGRFCGDKLPPNIK